MASKKNQSKSVLNVDTLLAQLEKRELAEATFTYNDPVEGFKTGYNAVSKWLGKLTPEQELAVHASQQFNNEATSGKWNRKLFEGVSGEEVNLSSFLRLEHAVRENFFSNYKTTILLQEDNKTIIPGSFDNKIMFIKDKAHTKGYVQTPVDKTLYITGYRSGAYGYFNSAKGKVTSKQGEKLQAFARLIAPQVIQSVVSEADNLFVTPEEKALLTQFKAAFTADSVFETCILYALVDILNLGTYSTSYGEQLKRAGTALANSPFLQSSVLSDHNELFSLSDKAANQIKTHLTEVLGYVNKYSPGPHDLKMADKQATAKRNVYGKLISALYTLFGNAVSKVTRALGNTDINLVELFLKTPEEKIKLLYTNPQLMEPPISFEGNPFLIVCTNHAQAMGGPVFKLHSIISSVPVVALDSNSYSIEFKVSNIDDKTPAVIPQLHNYLIQKAKGQGATEVTADDYLEAIASESGHEQAGAVNYKHTIELDTLLKNLYDPATQSLKDITLLAAIPKLFNDLIAFNIWTSYGEHKRIKLTSGEEIDQLVPLTAPNTHGHEGRIQTASWTAMNKGNIDEIYATFKDPATLYTEILTPMMTSDPDEKVAKALIQEAQEKFKNVCRSLHYGYWTTPELLAEERNKNATHYHYGLGLFSPLFKHTRGEIRLQTSGELGGVNDSPEQKKIAIQSTRAAYLENLQTKVTGE